MNITDLKKDNEIIGYRNTVINKLLSSPELAELCKNHAVEEENMESIVWDNYIPALFLDKTITEKEAYVMFDFNLEINRVDTYNDITLVFQVYCHKGIATAMNGSCLRIDAIISKLNELFVDKTILGTRPNKRIYDKILASSSSDFTAREVVYKIADFQEVTKKRG